MKRFILALAGGAVLSASACAFDATADFNRFLHSMLPRVNRAFNTKDVKFFEEGSTADFTETEGGKTLAKADAMAGLKQMFGMTKTSNTKIRIVSAKAKGNTGTAMTIGRTVATMKPMGPKDKKTHHMVVDMWYRETWIRSGKGWKIQKLEESKPSKITMDGKPFDPSKMAGG